MARRINWARTSVPLLGFVAAALVFVASLTITGSRIVEQAGLDANGHRIGFWESSQALSEAQRLRAELFRARLAEDGAAALALRFDILWSRLTLLEAGRDLNQNYPALEEVRRQLPAIFERMQRLEPLLAPARLAQESDFAASESLVGEILIEIGQVHRELNQDRQIQAEAWASGLARLRASFVVSGIGLVASATLLSALLFWLWRRAKGSLQDAEASRAEAARSERLLRVLVDALPVMVSAHDREGRFILANAAICRFLGAGEAMLNGRQLHEVTGRPGEQLDVTAALKGGVQLPFHEVEASDASAERRTLLTTVVPVGLGSGAPERAVRIAIDITERKQAEERVRHIAEHDVLTGLANRAQFSRALDGALARRGMVALHVIDLDDFKQVNDELGHAAGDALLVGVAERMQACLPPGAVLARLGGDEFAVVQPGIASEAEATRTVARLSHALARPHVITGVTVESNGSIGTAISPMDGAESKVLMQHADLALYRAKAAGRGRACRYAPEMEAEVTEQRRLEADVRRALEDGAFHFVFQPKFRVEDLAFAGCEALARWTHPVRGAVSPAVFMPAIDSAGLSSEFALYTLRAVLRQQRAWRAEGHVVKVAANLSARHVVTGEAPVLLREALAREGGTAADLEIEVTEDILIRDPQMAAVTLAKLREAGVRVALDDFGTGYSSLGYLQQLPFDTVKLDRAFVAGLGSATAAEQIVESVVSIAHGLGAKVVAEGVETVAQLARLRVIGCDEAQGFLLGRPMPARELGGLLRADAPRPITAHLIEATRAA